MGTEHAARADKVQPASSHTVGSWLADSMDQRHICETFGPSSCPPRPARHWPSAKFRYLHAKTLTIRESSAPSPSLQAICIQRLQEGNVEVFIFLMSRIRMHGFIGGFDNHTVMLQQPGSAQLLLYKRGIASIVPKADR